MNSEEIVSTKILIGKAGQVGKCEKVNFKEEGGGKRAGRVQQQQATSEAAASTGSIVNEEGGPSSHRLSDQQ